MCYSILLGCFAIFFLAVSLSYHVCTCLMDYTSFFRVKKNDLSILSHINSHEFVCHESLTPSSHFFPLLFSSSFIIGNWDNSFALGDWERSHPDCHHARWEVHRQHQRGRPKLHRLSRQGVLCDMIWDSVMCVRVRMEVQYYTQAPQSCAVCMNRNSTISSLPISHHILSSF